MAKRWRGFTSGAKIPNVRVYICAGCHGWNNYKPFQCVSCGGMDFIHFPSKAEAKRYGELMLEQKAGLISDLKLQPQYILHAAQINAVYGRGCSTAIHAIPLVKIGAYRGDFGYKRDGKYIVEDVKGGADTPLSAWKRKHVEAEHGVKINIVRR